MQYISYTMLYIIVSLGSLFNVLFFKKPPTMQHVLHDDNPCTTWLDEFMFVCTFVKLDNGFIIILIVITMRSDVCIGGKRRAPAFTTPLTAATAGGLRSDRRSLCVHYLIRYYRCLRVGATEITNNTANTKREPVDRSNQNKQLAAEAPHPLKSWFIDTQQRRRRRYT